MSKVNRWRGTFWILLMLWPLLATAVPVQPVLRDLAGKAHTVDEYRGHGKWLVVMVWASDCRVCNEEVHEMVDLQRRRGDRDTQVLGIAIDGYDHRDAVAGFIKRHHVNFPNLIDDGSVVLDLYRRGVGENWQGWTPTYLVYSPQGTLLAKNIGAVTRADVERFIDGAAQARAD
jgi:peroxiredoxin